MTISPNGTLFVGSVDAKNVYALPDANHDGKPDRVITIAQGLDKPNGVAFHRGALYVAEVSRILRFDDIEAHLDKPRFQVVSDKLPREQWHGWKYLKFGPDGWLYFGIGAPCNVCERLDDARFASITRMKLDGTTEIFAKGIRNTVGFDWHPATRELWFTDNGRDHLGDNLPPDELNHAPRKGMHFGFPYLYGRNVPDPEFGKKLPKGLDCTPCAWPLGPHVASLGMFFYTGKMFPQEYRNNIFIAEHGSWNRSKKIGYRIMRVTLTDNKPVEYQVFMEGFLQGEEAWGRPVDVCSMADGPMLVSDDRAGAIYKITYEGRNQP